MLAFPGWQGIPRGEARRPPQFIKRILGSVRFAEGLISRWWISCENANLWILDFNFAVSSRPAFVNILPLK